MIVERLPAGIERELFTEVGSFLVAQSRELAPGPIDINEATRNGLAVIAAGAALIARDDAGQIIGSLAFHEIPLSWCTSDGLRCLIDCWFVVAPDARHQGVAAALEAEAAKIGQERGLPVFIGRRRRIR